MGRTKPSRKVTMLERMVEMIVRIVLACVVADPFVPIHVGSIRMARLSLKLRGDVGSFGVP